jgi:hypothetical protein
MAFSTTEEVVITEDDPERPTVITWTFPDGLDTVVAPSLRRRHRSIHNNSNASGGGAASKHVFARDNDVVAVSPWLSQYNKGPGLAGRF